MPSAAAVIDRSLVAYNARDLEAFVACFAADVEMTDQKTGTVVMRGLDEVRATYGKMFAASPALLSEVLHRSAIGSFVVDHELVTGRVGGDVEILITYDVADDQIRRVWMVREASRQAVSIRRATVADAGAIVAIGSETYVQHFADIWTPAGLARHIAREFDPKLVHAELAGRETVYLLATDADGAVIGFAKQRLLPAPAPITDGTRAVELQKLYLRQNAVGSGIGRRLLRATLSAALQFKVGWIWLEVLERNARARRFYERNGFAVAGDYPFDTDLGAERMLIMSRAT